MKDQLTDSDTNGNTFRFAVPMVWGLAGKGKADFINIFMDGSDDNPPAWIL